MKTMVTLSLLLFGGLGFSQTKAEKMIDSVLVIKTGKTYLQYLTHFKEVDENHKAVVDKIRSQKREQNKTLPPTFPNKTYTAEDYPKVVVVKNNKEYTLQDLPKVSFGAIKKSFFLDNQQGGALYGTEGLFGVYFIEVE